MNESEKISKLDKSVTDVFKKIQEIEDSLKDLKLYVNHMEESAKKNRDKKLFLIDKLEESQKVLNNEIL
jgi:hypothetical protein